MSYRLTRLFFSYIKGSDLQRTGTTSMDLAKTLEVHGFIKILPDNHYIEMPKMFLPVHREELNRILKTRK